MERIELEWLTDYDDALKAIERQEHDVCLLEYRLGEHSGLELLREALERGHKGPIILLTGQGDREVDLEAMQAGAADYLVKGQIDAPLLERSIRYAFTRTLRILGESEKRFRSLVFRQGVFSETEGVGCFRRKKQTADLVVLASRYCSKAPLLSLFEISLFEELRD